MNDTSSRAFVNDPVSSGIPIREQSSVANNSEEEHATSITPSATSNSGDEGSDKAMESNNNDNDITLNGNGNAAQHHPDSSNSHNQHMGETSGFNEPPSFGSMNDTSGNAAYASSMDHQRNHPESVPHHELNGSAPAYLSGNHQHNSSNNMTAGEADERQAIADMEIQDSSHHPISSNSMSAGDADERQAIVDLDSSNHPSSSKTMSAGDADERQAIVDLEIQDSSNHPSSSNNMSAGDADERKAIVDLEIQDSSSGSDELEIIDPDEDDVNEKFGSVGLADGGVPMLEQQQQPQQQHDFSPNEATHHGSSVPMDAMDPIPVDLAHESATQHHASAKQQVEPAAVQAPAADAEVIELLDDDDDAASDNTDDLISKALTSNMNRAKRQKVSGDDNGNQTAQPSYQNPYETAQQSYQPPDESRWTQDTSSRRHGAAALIQPGQSLNLPADAKTDSAARAAQAIQQAYGAPVTQQPPLRQPMPPQPSLPPKSSLTPKGFQSRFKYDEPQYIPLPDGFVPTWNELVPAKPKPPPQQQYQHRSNERKYFQLSLLNVNDFTITGLPISFDGPPTSISGMRVPIRQVSREHGKAVYESDKEGGPGKWRIPLGAYHAFFAYLRSDPNCRVEGISSIQLKVASLERARQEKGYPSVEKLVEAGVPSGLAKTLAPFQRGGVDFVLEKKGRALIADDMGLGKTIQAIASMSVYRKEWPILVLTPSSARYHWATEFKNWLGAASDINKPQDGEEMASDLLQESQINVLTSSKVDVLPNRSTKVVICSYGLAPALIESGKVFPGLFRCAIVDESHMLKNKATKRTSTLVPILNATNRCVLLSGTPALSRPGELWPQLVILGADTQGWWRDEADFIDKYVKKGNSRRRAELHTMLTGTVMIRRMKADMLKSLPNKVREKAAVHILDNEQRNEFKALLMELRESKGALGKIARGQHAHALTMPATTDAEPEQPEDQAASGTASGVAQPESASKAFADAAEADLKVDFEEKLSSGKAKIFQMVAATGHNLGPTEQHEVMRELEGKLIADLEGEYHRRMIEIKTHMDNCGANRGEAPKDTKRTTLLNRLYGLTGDVKIPLIVDMLKRWLRDPTKGKICIFAHHLSVLNSIQELAGLSNEKDSSSKYIRIDGSTLPKRRQEHINDFQTDPSIRVALLGITAAGVAVTLTACSNVWFAELFWTPAIMVQAEDRCHRIGQQARVKCLYFVAKGTLDDVLFRLLEKKLQDIGEFVEGKEKLKLVVHKTYESTKELHTMFDNVTEGDSDEDGEMGDMDDFGQELQLDGELEHDIEQLGEEEERMLRLAEKDDDEPDAAVSNGDTAIDDRKMPAVDVTEETKAEGGTEEEAIMLSDDDDDEVEVTSKPAATPSSTSNGESSTGADGASKEAFNIQGSLHKCRLYRVRMEGPSLGISVAFYKHRVVVEKLHQDRIDRIGENSKPCVGDVLVGINGQRLPLISILSQVMQHLRSVMQRPPVELTFAEDPDFADFYKNTVMLDRLKQHPVVPPPVADANGVIDLLDDD